MNSITCTKFEEISASAVEFEQKKLCVHFAVNLARGFGTLNRYLWAFVDGELIVNAPRSLKDPPAETALSRTQSKDLVKRGFWFVRRKIATRSCNQLTRVSSTKTWYFTSS